MAVWAWRGPRQGAAVTLGHLLGEADAAMYEAKAAGKDRVAVFETAMRSRSISVNISGWQLQDPGFPDTVKQVLDSAGRPGAWWST